MEKNNLLAQTKTLQRNLEAAITANLDIFNQTDKKNDAAVQTTPAKLTLSLWLTTPLSLGHLPKLMHQSRPMKLSFGRLEISARNRLGSKSSSETTWRLWTTSMGSGPKPGGRRESSICGNQRSLSRSCQAHVVRHTVRPGGQARG